jgi:hypothetical protein
MYGLSHFLVSHTTLTSWAFSFVYGVMGHVQDDSFGLGGDTCSVACLLGSVSSSIVARFVWNVSVFPDLLEAVEASWSMLAASSSNAARLVWNASFFADLVVLVG